MIPSVPRGPWSRTPRWSPWRWTLGRWRPVLRPSTSRNPESGPAFRASRHRSASSETSSSGWRRSSETGSSGASWRQPGRLPTSGSSEGASVDLETAASIGARRRKDCFEFSSNRFLEPGAIPKFQTGQPKLAQSTFDSSWLGQRLSSRQNNDVTDVRSPSTKRPSQWRCHTAGKTGPHPFLCLPLNTGLMDLLEMILTVIWHWNICPTCNFCYGNAIYIRKTFRSISK